MRVWAPRVFERPLVIADADRGGGDVEAIVQAHLERERVRQLEERGLQRLRRAAQRMGLL